MNCFGDLHCDTLWRCFENRTDLDDPMLQNKRKVPFRRLTTYAIFIPEEEKDPYRYFRAVYAYSEELFRNYPDLVLCRTAGEIDRAFEQGKMPYLFSVENGNFFGNDPEKNRRIARELKQKGIAFLSLCYNKGNALAGGALTDGGLTPLGREVALLLREEGIILDLSHLNHPSTDDLLALLPDGVVATHSNCFALRDHPRNLTDGQIRALIQKEGLMGINFYPPFLTDGRYATISDILVHVRHVLNLGGERILAFGSDFDGIDRTPTDLPTSAELPRLGNLLNQDFLYGNMKRFLDRFLK